MRPAGRNQALQRQFRYSFCVLYRAILCIPTGHLPYKHIVVVAGNNELSLDSFFLRSDNRNHTAKEVGLRQAINASLVAQRIASVKLLLTNCHYLEDDMIELYGIKIYGTPW